MIPVDKTGLHCGYESAEDLRVLRRHVIPVDKTGLHCGQAGTFTGAEQSG